MRLVKGSKPHSRSASELIVSDQGEERMSEILKVLGWPHFSFLFVLIFVLLFRSQLAGLISVTALPIGLDFLSHEGYYLHGLLSLL
jgi:hypothetical protein